MGRAVLLLAIYLGLTLLIGGLLAYPAWLVLESFTEPRFERVVNRSVLITAFLLLPFFLWVAKATDRNSLGFSHKAGEFLSRSARGFVAGITSLLPVSLALCAGGIRVPVPDWPAALGAAILYIPNALLTGITVAVIEEALFRGGILGGLLRMTGTRAAVVLSSLLFAAVHFLKPAHGLPMESISWTNAYLSLANGLAQLALPQLIADDFLALFCAGLILAWARCRYGSIAIAIGLHAGWVLVIRLTRKATELDPASPLHFLVGNFDGVIGWLACCWFCAVTAAYVLLFRHRR